MENHKLIWIGHGFCTIIQLKLFFMFQKILLSHHYKSSVKSHFLHGQETWAFNHHTVASVMGHNWNQIICFSSTTMEWDFEEHRTRKWEIRYSLFAKEESGLLWWTNTGRKHELLLMYASPDMAYRYQ